MKKGKDVSTEKTPNAFLEGLEQLSKVQRVLIWVLVMGGVIAAFYFVSFKSGHEKIDGLKVSLAGLEKDLAKEKKTATGLNAYRKQLEEAEVQFAETMRALPEKEEIPALLTGISKAGKSSGLVFELFEMKPEVAKDFYAEIPIDIRAVGDYHGMATFLEEVSRLNRIVNIRNITIAPAKTMTRKTARGSTTVQNEDALAMMCTAVTYKFIEDSTSATNAKKKNTKSKR